MLPDEVKSSGQDVSMGLQLGWIVGHHLFVP